MTRSRHALLLAAAVAAAAAPLRGQEPDRERVGDAERALMEAVVRSYHASLAGPPRMLVAGVPEPFRDLVYLPPGSRLLGSVHGERGIEVFATTSLSRDSAAVALAAGLPGLGWRRDDPEGGLVRPPPESLSFCNPDGLHLTAVVWPREAGPTDLRISILRLGRECEPLPEYSALRGAVPRLRPPDGALGPGCMAMGWSATGGLPMRAEDARSLMDHYAAQMERHGWRPIDRAPAIGRSWETGPDREEPPLTASILVMTDPTRPDCQVLFLTTSGKREP